MPRTGEEALGRGAMRGGVNTELSGDVVPFEGRGVYAYLLCAGCTRAVGHLLSVCVRVDTGEGDCGCTGEDERRYSKLYVFSNSYLSWTRAVPQHGLFTCMSHPRRHVGKYCWKEGHVVLTAVE